MAQKTKKISEKPEPKKVFKWIVTLLYCLISHKMIEFTAVWEENEHE